MKSDILGKNKHNFVFTVVSISFVALGLAYTIVILEDLTKIVKILGVTLVMVVFFYIIFKTIVDHTVKIDMNGIMRLTLRGWRLYKWDHFKKEVGIRNGYYIFQIPENKTKIILHSSIFKNSDRLVDIIHQMRPDFEVKVW